MVLAGSQLPSSLIFARLTPGPVLIVILWVVGLKLIAGPGSRLPWADRGEASDGQEQPRGHARKKTERAASSRRLSTAHVGGVFGVAARLTLVAGVTIEQSGEKFFGNLGLSGVLFGATVLSCSGVAVMAGPFKG